MFRPIPPRLTFFAELILCLSLIFGGLIDSPAAAAPAPVAGTVTIDVTQTAEPISPYIYGQFIEHLGRCIYGGIWAEMLEDRKFYYPVPADGDIWRLTRAQARVLAASPWKVIGPETNVQMVEEDPFVGDHCPQLTTDGKRPVGIYQEELGIVKGKRYSGYIYLAGDKKVGPVKVCLIWGEGPLAEDVTTIKKIKSKYRQYAIKFTAGADSDNARLEIVATGQGTLRIGCVSLMPSDNVEGFRKDTLELLKQLNAPVYRWPGGNFVSGYDWRDGLGDRDKRPTRTNPAWTGIETNDMGMDEFITFCRLIDAEPMIAVNTGFGDAYSAAAEVEYANGSTKTPMGKWRKENGHAKPYNVKWWCVGNEMFGRWQLGYMALNHYVLKHNWIEEKMRQVDPTIKTIGVGEVGAGMPDPNEQERQRPRGFGPRGPRSWSMGMLQHCADQMDLISEHFYVREKENIPEHVQQVPNQIKRIADAHREFRARLPELQGKEPVPVALDEWNYWYGPHVFGELGTRYFLKDALGIAAGLHEYFRNTDVYMMANYAQTVNVIGCIKTTKTAAEFDSTGLPLMLYRREFGTIPVQIEHDSEPLDISVALTKDKKAITIGVVNPTDDPYDLTLDLTAVTPRDDAECWVITGDDPMAYNDPGQPRRVDIEQGDATDLTGTVSVKPLSITLFKAPVKLD